MNKTAIKNFAIWARNKLIADISYKAGLLGITEKGIKSPLPQSTQTVQFFDIGTKEPSSITGLEIQQRKKLVDDIERKAKQSDYITAYKNVIEEVTYTWFNRMIAIRFMEVNDYLPTRIRVLSSESNGKMEPDIVTHALEVNLDYSAYEKDRIIQLKHENKLDELFRMLFIKQCNALNVNLPYLFEKTSDYTELLLNVSFTDKEGVVCHLVNDIDEDDFNVSKEGQVEIIGWLYQYYNTEPKDETFALLKKNVKITKERIPAATQLFTPDWIVRYMVENSLGRLWIEGHPNDELKSGWKYYLDEAEQDAEVQKQLEKIRVEYKNIKPEDIKVIDPAVGSGHILVYTFDVLMQIYVSYGFNQRDAAKSIVENNLYGLDIDNRAYQLAYFAVMMKARQYNRKILDGVTQCHVYAIQESNSINRNQLKYFGAGHNDIERNTALLQIQGLLDAYKDAKEYGSIIFIENYNWNLLRKFINDVDMDGQLSLDSLGLEVTKNLLDLLINIGENMARRYDVVVTNPPYMGSSGMSVKLSEFVKNHYPDSKSDLFAVFIEKCGEMTKSTGYQAMITQHVWMFLTSFQKLRGKLYYHDIVNMVHLGARAFEEIAGEVVQSTSFVIRGRSTKGYKGTYVRLVDYEDAKSKELEFLGGNHRYVADIENFSKIPGSSIAYWIPNGLINAFSNYPKLGEFIDARIGMVTGDNSRFLRLWYEVDISKVEFGAYPKMPITSKLKWFPLQKGGGFNLWYGNAEYVINWENDGWELKNDNSIDGRVRSHNYNGEQIFKEGITWNSISTTRFVCRYSPSGFIFDAAGPLCEVKNRKYLFHILAFLSSKAANYILQTINPTINFPSGYLEQLPYIVTLDSLLIETAVINNISLSRADWDAFETSWDFKHHPLVCGERTVESAFVKWEFMAADRFKTLKANEEKLNQIFIDIYGLSDELRPDVEEKDVTVRRAALGRDIRSLISYAVGCMFGRYSLDVEGLAYAGGNWDSSKYLSYVPDKDNILPITDEEYFQDDICGQFCTWLKKVYGEESLEDNLDFIAKALGKKGNTSREAIRNYFLNDFFKDHCATYSVTGSGKRPIYWLFDSGKQNGIKALVYMHRYDENTIGNLRIDYLHRIQRIYENEIARMQDTIENSKDAREVSIATKRKEKLIKQLQETKEYDEKIAHLALARTPIDLDDGVKVNYEKVQTDRDGKKLGVLAKI